MASNAQKIPLVYSLNQGMARAAENRVHLLGKCLPCSVVSVSGAIVTVKFEVKNNMIALPQVKMPLFGPEYVRYPIQVGDKGFAISADAALGKMSGLGTATADVLQQPPNLGALAFMPCGNQDWRSVDHNALVLYGPNGVVLQDSQQTCTITLTPNGVSINLGMQPLTITAQNVTLDSSGNLVIKGDLTWGATPTHASTHHHTLVTAGTAQSGPPQPGT